MIDTEPEVTESDDDRPDGLGDRAAQLWKGVRGTYALRVDELYLLEAACRQVDIIDAMAARQEAEDLLATGYNGQPVAAPLLGELRAHRGLLATLLKQLKLPDDDSKAAETASDKARRAAQARWGRGGAI
jgi:hypothetical protein